MIQILVCVVFSYNKLAFLTTWWITHDVWWSETRWTGTIQRRVTSESLVSGCTQHVCQYLDMMLVSISGCLCGAGFTVIASEDRRWLVQMSIRRRSWEREGSSRASVLTEASSRGRVDSKIISKQSYNCFKRGQTLWAPPTSESLKPQSAAAH